MSTFDASKATHTLPFGQNDIRASLNVGTPRQGDPHGTYNHDRLIMVPIDQIDRYENNPRRRRKKEAWVEFKESIRAVGVKQPIKITQKPGSNRYQIIEGGNSRHQALEELFLETSDDRFLHIPALFQAWDDEQFQPVNVLLAHITENEMRSEVLFWDKAQAYCQAIELLGISAESARNISNTLQLRGNAVSYELINQFLFANSKLKYLNQLCYGLSGVKVIDLRRIYHDFRKSLEAKSDEFESFWESTLSTYAETNSVNDFDEPTLNNAGLIKYIKQNYLEQFPEAASALLQKNSRVPSTKIQSDLIGATDNTTSTSEATDSSHTSNQSNAEVDGNHATESGAFNQTVIGSTDGYAQSEATSAGLNTEQNQELMSFASSLVKNEDEENEGKNLHERILDLMNYCGIGHLFREIPAFPFQFFVELPYFEPQELTDGNAFPLDLINPYARDVWWLLATISYQLDSTHEAFMGIPNESMFMQTFIDSAVWQGYISQQLGESTPFAMENWLMFCPDETFISLLNGMLKQVRQINSDIFKHGENQ